MVAALRDDGEDFEWYPTTSAMIDVVIADAKRRLNLDPNDHVSVLDIGAGDGRVLARFHAVWAKGTFFSIEKSTLLQAAQPDWVVPAGTDFREQDLMAVQSAIVFCNPPYSEFEAWAARIIAESFCTVLYLIIPQRWVDSPAIKRALALRGAKAKVLQSTDFANADRSARAKVDIIRIQFAARQRGWGRDETPDPFKVWFEQNVSSFDEEEDVAEATVDDTRLARLRGVTSIAELVAEFDLDYQRMQENYQAIFNLDGALLRELGVKKDALCTALKTRLAGLKRVYWRALFDRLNTLTTRLATKTRAEFLEILLGRNALAFTVDNCCSIVMWAVKRADTYVDRQIVDLFFELSQRDGVTRYVSNQRTWTNEAWRYSRRNDESRPSHFRLDYRFIIPGHSAIGGGDFRSWDFPGGLYTRCHELIDDIVAVLSTLGFFTASPSSIQRTWHSGRRQEWLSPNGEVLFEVRAFINGNLHMRFASDAIMAINVEAGRLLGWLKSPAEAATELEATQEQAERAWGSLAKLDAARTLALVAGSGEGA